jgi:hypothetical protein
MPIRKPHHPLTKHSSKTRTTITIHLNRIRRWPRHRLPPADRWPILSPIKSGKYSVTTVNGGVFRALSVTLSARRASDAVGVGSIFTPTVSASEPLPFSTCLRAPADPIVAWWSAALGVGSSVTIVVRCVDFSIERPRVRGLPMIPSEAFGVGKSREDEKPLTMVRGTNVGSSKACPPRMQPVFGHVSEYSIEPQRPVSGHILQENVAGS